MKSLKLIALTITLISFHLIAQDIEFLNPKKIDHGRVKQGEIIKGSIRFVNLGENDIKISNIRKSCGCTAATSDKDTYAKGDTGEVAYTVKTAGFRGVIKKSIRISFEGGKTEKASFTIQANVTSELNIIPSSIMFSNISLNPDTVITEYFEIENELEKPLVITKINYENENLKITPTSAEIPPHKSQLFRIEFQPTKEGRQNTQISIQTNYQPKPLMYLPVFINISS